MRGVGGRGAVSSPHHQFDFELTLLITDGLADYYRLHLVALLVICRESAPFSGLVLHLYKMSLLICRLRIRR